jgi:dethiobiotin synthetase
MHSARGLFITGTDTGVGKTQVTAALAVGLQARGLCVGVMKPAETGCPMEQGSLMAQDAIFLRQVSGCQAPQELVTPYTFLEPLAPAVAAEHEGRAIDIEHIIHCYMALAKEHDIVLVEGAGGLLVPLTQQESFLDLAARLDLPLLVVARNMLGTINHTALTVMVAAQRCRVLGTVLNTLSPGIEDASQTSNSASIQRWGRAPLLGVLPYAPERTPESLLAQSAHIDFTTIQAQLSLSTQNEVQL